MLRTNIYLEERQHEEIEELARREDRKVSELIREILDEGIRVRKRQQWARAAELMANDYANDKELTVFTALDGEDFLE
jgi:predicted DNA-binding ribbon-helix-helix protein